MSDGEPAWFLVTSLSPEVTSPRLPTLPAEAQVPGFPPTPGVLFDIALVYWALSRVRNHGQPNLLEVPPNRDSILHTHWHCTLLILVGCRLTVAL